MMFPNKPSQNSVAFKNNNALMFYASVGGLGLVDPGWAQLGSTPSYRWGQVSFICLSSASDEQVSQVMYFLW